MLKYFCDVCDDQKPKELLAPVQFSALAADNETDVDALNRRCEQVCRACRVTLYDKLTNAIIALGTKVSEIK